MPSIVKKWKYWFGESGLLVVGSLVLLFAIGLRPGIELAGGSLSELEFDDLISISEMRQSLSAADFKNVVVQAVDERTVIIKTEPLEGEKLESFRQTLEDGFGLFQEKRFESIGPSISRELVGKAYWQVGLVLIGILAYIAYAFRRVSEVGKRRGLTSWRLAAAAILALIHDLLITIGLFVILGKFRGVEIDSLFITALLTIMGFSVHDTIVVFDRVRETVQKEKYETLGNIIDASVNATLARSINTSSTLIFVLVALLFFGGETIFNFVLALLIGVSIGTYSSIFIASPILYLWSSKTRE